MKFNNRIILAIISCTFLMTSCQNLTEEITIELDGSGKYQLYSDAIPSMLTVMTTMDSMMAIPDSTGKIVRKSQAEIEEQIWKDFPESIDSTLDIMSELPDSIKNDPEKMAMLEKTRVYMTGGRTKGYMNVGMAYNYDDLEELKVFNGFLSNVLKEGSNSGSPLGRLEEPEMTSDFIYSDKGFKRIFEVQKKVTFNEQEEGMLQMFVGQGTLTTIVYLPKEAKDVKGDYLKSIKGKTVTFEYPMQKYMRGDIDCSFEVLFK